ncbi:substrate-binding periplasmic protein [Bdellovibrio sp. HCB337]|uniref:substrate-binding periplasmic protein n=1 Tax=Bdellovibrio sp. HCB337 TaxID=3394358 RepID=UPI0039A607F3
MKYLVALLFLTSVSHAGENTTLCKMSYEPGYENISSYAEGLNFMAKVLTQSGCKVEVVPLPQKRGLEMLNKNVIDFSFGITKAERKSGKPVLLSSFPFAHIKQKIAYVKTDKAFSFNKVPELRGVTILNTFSLNQYADKHSLNLLEVRTPRQGLDMLLHGRVDYLIAADVIIQDLVEKNQNIKKTVVTYPTTLTTEALYLGIGRRHISRVETIEKNLKLALAGDLAEYPHLRPLLNTTAKPE